MGLIFDENWRDLEAFYDFVLNDIGADKLKLNFLQPSFGEDGEVDAAAVDLEFHRTIWAAAGNDQLAKTLDSLSTVLFAHTALENVSQDVMAWRLNHHRALLDVVLGASDTPAEAAVIDHLKTHYKNPERFSSFGSSIS